MPPRYWMVEISSLRESESHVESASRVRVTKGREWISSTTRRQRTPGSWNARRGSSDHDILPSIDRVRSRRCDTGAWQGAFPQQLSRLAVEGSYLAVVVCCRNEHQAASRYYRSEERRVGKECRSRMWPSQ